MIDFKSLPNVVAIVGSRAWPESKEHWIVKAVNSLTSKTIVVSGGALGVDFFAKRATLARRDIHYKEFAVEHFEWDLFGNLAGHMRNEQIVQYLKKHDGHMLIFALREAWDKKKGGSYNDSVLCTKYEVPWTVIHEDKN